MCRYPSISFHYYILRYCSIKCAKNGLGTNLKQYITDLFLKSAYTSCKTLTSVTVLCPQLKSCIKSKFVREVIREGVVLFLFTPFVYLFTELTHSPMFMCLCVCCTPLTGENIIPFSQLKTSGIYIYK